MKYTVRQLQAMPVGTMLMNTNYRPRLVAVKAAKQYVGWVMTSPGEIEGFKSNLDMAGFGFTHRANPAPIEAPKGGTE